MRHTLSRDALQLMNPPCRQGGSDTGPRGRNVAIVVTSSRSFWSLWKGDAKGDGLGNTSKNRSQYRTSASCRPLGRRGDQSLGGTPCFPEESRPGRTPGAYELHHVGVRHRRHERALLAPRGPQALEGGRVERHDAAAPAQPPLHEAAGEAHHVRGDAVVDDPAHDLPFVAQAEAGDGIEAVAVVTPRLEGGHDPGGARLRGLELFALLGAQLRPGEKLVFG